MYWTTASEVNNDYFTVEKISTELSVLEGKWQTIDTIKGAGNSSVHLYYDTPDKDPYQGTSYYRLKQVDFNGDYTYSDLKAINMNGLDIINLSPNPAENEIKVLLYSNETTNISTKVFNVLGQKIMEEKQIANEGTTELLIDVSTLSTGYYMIEVMTESGLYRSQKKLVKH